MPGQTNNLKKLVCVMSTNYSGSTVLGAILGNHSKAVFLGEPALIVRRRPDGDWRHHRFCAVCSAAGTQHTCPVWGDASVAAIRKDPDRVYQIAAEQLRDATTFIDASKDMDWLRASATRVEDAVCVHLVRPVEAHVASVLTRRKRQSHAIEVLAARWAAGNLEIERTCATLRMPYKLVRYGDFVSNPANSLAELAPLTGLNPEPNQHEFWHKPTHFVKSNPGVLTHYDRELVAREPGLNRDLYEQNHRRLFVDEKWREMLTAQQIARLYASPQVHEVSERFGLLGSRRSERAPSSLARAQAHATLGISLVVGAVYSRLNSKR
ncbi:MAG: hypothetical protein IPK60_02770 [Sandaracinaceae bacterium]|nr:hypothetical protein [Sandaracinaceae bacterium]